MRLTGSRISSSLISTYLISLVLIIGFGPAALAGDGREVVEHIFEMADADEDGALSATEYEEAELARYGVSFEQTDADGDGSTSFEEYLSLYEAHHPPAGSCTEKGETI